MINKNATILTRTNSVTQVPQYGNQVQYTSPLQEVQRRVLNDFAAQVQSTLNQPQQQQQQQFDETNTWERESIDSLESIKSIIIPQQIISPPKLTGPIVRPNHLDKYSIKKTTTNH